MGYGVADTGVDFDYVTPQEAHALLKSDKVLFVDCRDREDFANGHIQTAYSLPANDIMFHQDKLDRTLVQRCADLSKRGKIIVVYSDAGITGMRNRGHVSRCRHVAQYLVELGVDQEFIRRLTGGLNKWKGLQLDGVLGDNRMYYAGQLMTQEQHLKVLAEAQEDEAVSPGPAAIASASTASPAPPVPESTPAQEGDSAASASASLPIALAPTSQPLALAPVVAQDNIRADTPGMVTSPTVYRVLKGEVYKKANPEAEKIVKLDWKVDRLVRTTGQVFTGASGGKWAELDEQAGEKKGWVYVVGPGFGPSSCKVTTEFMVA